MQRLVPDPSVGVSDLMAPLETWFKNAKTRNIAHLLGRPVGLSWKTAPNPVWLAKLKPFIMDLVPISAHLVFASKKVKGALVKCNLKEKINYSKKDDDDFLDVMDDTIRLACKQLRDLKNDQGQKARSLSKCSQEEAAAIEEMLEAMVCKTEAVVVPKVPSSWSGIADSIVPATSSNNPTHPEPVPLADTDPKVTTDIFKRVLDRKVSDASSLPSPVKQSDAAFNCFGSFASTGLFNPEEMAMLNHTLTQNKLQATKHTLKPKKKANQKQDKAAAGSQEKVNAKKKRSKKGRNSKPSKVMKKPANQVDEPVRKKVCRKSAPAALYGEASEEVPPNIESVQDVAADAPKTEVDVKTMRKRSTSKAYHTAYKKTLGEGKSKEEAKAAAQAAYAEEAKKWDDGEDIE
jgi:hypothetical protein